MSNIIFELYVEKMDWDSDEIKSEITHIESYKALNVKFIEERFSDLQGKIMDAKNDGVRFNCDIVGGNVYIQIFLMFGSHLGNGEERIISKVKFYCEQFCRDLEESEEFDEASSISNFKLLDKIFDEDGYIFRISDLEVVEPLTELLSSKGISYKTIRHKKGRLERGFSDAYEEILIFIGQSMVSGFAWDIIKRVVSRKFGRSFVQSAYVDSKRFKQLRKDIADRIVENYKDLVLTNYNRKRNKIICEFKIYGIVEKTITVVCDSEYRIKELKLEESK